MKSPRARRPLVLDAGPLLTYVAMHFAAEYRLSSDFVQEVWGLGALDRFQQELASEFISHSANVYFPGYVLIEALQLRRNVWKHRESEFVPFAQGFVAAKLTELPLTVNELYADDSLRLISQRFGIADAAVLYAAIRHSADVLTDDGGLYQHVLDDPNFEIFLFRNVVTARLYDDG